ncbi:hypothetical protein C943_00795 [Mariniradius saccharolyticus AK6]|uniref:Uncharacterized protein n=1 Tax=Mariniradius saccharolyticus AK6 TaxID=1239962 RepID=M7XD33_9BACT|nr:hypothetical protein C943_00795 [Mariniradius saccharolyticus AK6]
MNFRNRHFILLEFRRKKIKIKLASDWLSNKNPGSDFRGF